MKWLAFVALIVGLSVVPGSSPAAAADDYAVVTVAKAEVASVEADAARLELEILGRNDTKIDRGPWGVTTLANLLLRGRAASVKALLAEHAGFVPRALVAHIRFVDGDGAALDECSAGANGSFDDAIDLYAHLWKNGYAWAMRHCAQGNDIVARGFAHRVLERDGTPKATGFVLELHAFRPDKNDYDAVVCRKDRRRNTQAILPRDALKDFADAHWEDRNVSSPPRRKDCCECDDGYAVDAFGERICNPWKIVFSSDPDNPFVRCRCSCHKR